MDAATIRAMLEQQFEHAGSDPELSHAMYREDAVLEFPQSGERFEGVPNFREWRRRYPATKVDFDVRRVRGSGDAWVVELRVRYDGGPWNYGVEILEFRESLVARETIYVMDGWEAPEWRSEWWAAPPNPVAGGF
jgi:hypothetical protein